MSTGEITTTFFDKNRQIEKEKLGEFVTAFFSAFKSLRIYGDDRNDTVQKSLEKLNGILRFFLVTHPSVTIEHNGVDLYINDQRIKRRRTGNENIDGIGTIFSSFAISRMILPAQTEKKDFSELFSMIRNFIGAAKGDDNAFENLAGELQRAFSPIEIIMRKGASGGGYYSVIGKAQMARLIYRNLVNDFPLFLANIKLKKALPVRKAVRAIQNLIDLMSDTSSDSQRNHLLVMSGIPSVNKRFIPSHAASVTILAVACGISLKLTTNEIMRLGLMAYLHDLGIDEDNVRNTVADHGGMGFAYLSRLNSLNYSMMEASLLAGAHHATYDFIGRVFPPETMKPSTPLGEIVKICDYYDIATKWWPWLKRPPQGKGDAMRKVFEYTKSRCFAPIAAKALFGALGYYPPGSLMRVRNKPFVAYVLSPFTDGPAKCAVFSSTLEYMLTDVFSVDDLEDMPRPFRFRLPPETLQKVLEVFQPAAAKEMNIDGEPEESEDRKE